MTLTHMKKNGFLIAPLLAGLAAGPVVAGGLDVIPPEPPVVVQQAPVMQGADWGGFYGGGQLGYGDADVGALGGDGGFAGAHLGYRWDFGNAVIGAEVDYDFADIGLDNGVDSIDDVARLKFSAGYDLGQTLIYGTAGVAQASANVGAVDFSDQGWLVGAGVSYDLGNRWLLGGEVLHHQFDNFDATALDVDVTTLSARLSYRF